MPAIHVLMMKPIYAGTVTRERELNDILQSQMQSLLDHKHTGAIAKTQLLPRSEKVTVEVTTPGSPLAQNSQNVWREGESSDPMSVVR